MPHSTRNPAKAGSTPSAKTPPGPISESRPPDANPAKPAPQGALFRALMDAGADAMVAYTAERQIHAMVLEIAAAQAQPILLEMRRFAGEQGGKLDSLSARLDSLSARVDSLSARVNSLSARVDSLSARVDKLAEDGAERDRKLMVLDSMNTRLDKLTEDGAERDRKLDVLVAQMRLLMGGMGLLVTVLIAVFGFLFAT